MLIYLQRDKECQVNVIKSKVLLLIAGTVFFLGITAYGHADSVRIGLNYPQTGPYSVQGKAQLDAARLAVQEINDPVD
ncbi:MAG: hypothetical protein D3908_08175 [Candidatus Electrothrix sp. AUS4]|nr:hypothetical protein [Candidatus Electrothrix sp. AUS4]